MKKFAAVTLVTDTVVFDVVKATTKTVTLRYRGATDEVLKSEHVDGNPMPVVWVATEPVEGAELKTLKMRADGTFRMWGGSIVRFYDEDPGRRVDYRF